MTEVSWPTPAKSCSTCSEGVRACSPSCSGWKGSCRRSMPRSLSSQDRGHRGTRRAEDLVLVPIPAKQRLMPARPKASRSRQSGSRAKEAVTTLSRGESELTVRYSPLDAWHRDHGARMVPFGGWEMPLEYPDGTVAEHMSCRRHAAIFDVSHLGTVRLVGSDAEAVLQSALTNDLRKIAPGRAQYTHLLDDGGSVLDDLIVWWV